MKIINWRKYLSTLYSHLDTRRGPLSILNKRYLTPSTQRRTCAPLELQILPHLKEINMTASGGFADKKTLTFFMLWGSLMLNIKNDSLKGIESSMWSQQYRYHQSLLPYFRLASNKFSVSHHLFPQFTFINFPNLHSNLLSKPFVETHINSLRFYTSNTAAQHPPSPPFSVTNTTGILSPSSHNNHNISFIHHKTFFWWIPSDL